MSNSHYDEAETVGRYYATHTLDNDADVIAMGQVEATLALAYEQRTANLIAIWQTGDIKVGNETFGITGEKRISLYNEIAIRLGFKEQP